MSGLIFYGVEKLWVFPQIWLIVTAVMDLFMLV